LHLHLSHVHLFSISSVSLSVNSFDVDHGLIKSTAYVIKKIAYISDCNKISEKSFKYLSNLNYLIIDCLRKQKHPTHFNFEESMKIIDILKPKKAILTNLHNDLDYKKLKSKLPSNIIPAFDGLKFNF